MKKLSGATDTLPTANESAIHLKSIEDLQSHGIQTLGMGLEGKKINLKTTLGEIQELKANLEQGRDKTQTLKDFLKLEQSVTSRESVIAVNKLKQTVDQESESETVERDVEAELLAKAEATIEDAPTIEKPKGGKENTFEGKALIKAREKIEDTGNLWSFIGVPLFDWIIKNDNKETNRYILGAAKGILSFLGFDGVFKDYKKDLSEVKNIKGGINNALEGGKQAVAENKNAIEGVAYTAGAQLLIQLSDKSTGATYDVFSQKVIQDMSFSELVQKKGSDIEQSTISNTGEIDAAISLLKDQEKTLDSILGKKNPDWKNMSIREILGGLQNYADLFSTLDSVDFSDLSQKFDFGNISFIHGQPAGGSLGMFFEEAKNNPNSKLKGVSLPLFLDILALKTKANSSEFESRLSGNNYDNAKDTEFEKDFSQFSIAMFTSIKSHFYLGDEMHRTEYEDYINTRGITPKEALEFYIITGGERDPSQYSETIKTLLYLKIWGMLGKEKGLNSVRINTYNAAIGDAIGEKGTEAGEKVPPQVKLIAKRLLVQAGDSAFEGVKQLTDIASEVMLFGWNQLNTPGKAVLIGGGALTVIAVMKSRFTIAKISGGIIATKVILLFLGAMVTSAYADKAFVRKVEQKTGRKNLTEEQLKELVIADFEKTRDIDLSIEDIPGEDTPETQKKNIPETTKEGVETSFSYKDIIVVTKPNDVPLIKSKNGREYQLTQKGILVNETDIRNAFRGAYVKEIDGVPHLYLPTSEVHLNANTNSIPLDNINNAIADGTLFVYKRYSSLYFNFTNVDIELKEKSQNS